MSALPSVIHPLYGNPFQHGLAAPASAIPAAAAAAIVGPAAGAAPAVEVPAPAEEERALAGPAAAGSPTVAPAPGIGLAAAAEAGVALPSVEIVPPAAVPPPAAPAASGGSPPPPPTATSSVTEPLTELQLPATVLAVATAAAAAGAVIGSLSSAPQALASAHVSPGGPSPSRLCFGAAEVETEMPVPAARRVSADTLTRSGMLPDETHRAASAGTQVRLTCEGMCSGLFFLKFGVENM